MRKRIAVSAGDPGGIGPELCLRAAADPRVSVVCDLSIFADRSVLQRAGDALGLSLPRVVVTPALLGDAPAGAHALVDCGALAADAVQPGRIAAAHGAAAARYIRDAVVAVSAGAACGLATAPISKEALHLAGIAYPGHTEMLADLTGAGEVCMMMASDELNVSLATIHIPYREVPARLTVTGLRGVMRLTRAAVMRMGKSRAHLTVCGLNPHAGEHGLFGTEERDVIEPAIAAARAEGMDVEGPLPPDTAFLPAVRERTDAYIVMYHDQGLIPFKMLAFERGVNVTLGLPIVRTSPDHGTAFDIAWQGKASPESFVHSILWACRLAG